MELDLALQTHAAQLFAGVRLLVVGDVQAGHLAAGGLGGVGEPQGGIAVGGAEFEDALGARVPGQGVQELAGLTAHRQQHLVAHRALPRSALDLPGPFPRRASLVFGEHGLQSFGHPGSSPIQLAAPLLLGGLARRSGWTCGTRSISEARTARDAKRAA